MKKFILNGLIMLMCMNLSARENFDSIKVLLQKAQIEREAGRHKMALEYLQKAVSADPKLIEAQKILGLEALELRQFDMARQAFQIVLESNPNDVVVLEKITGIFFSFRKWDDAIKYGQKLLSLNAGQKMNFILGKCYYEKEDYGKSFMYLDKAYVEDPKNIEIPTMFARGLVDMSNFKAAVKYYQDAVMLDSNNARLYNELAMTCSSMNDEKSAVKYYEIAIAKGIKVDNDFVENLSNSYLAAGMTDKGMQMLKQLLEKKPGDIDLLNNVADNYYRLGNYQEAMNHWDKVLYLDKENARSLYMIGMCYIKMGDKNKGATLCNKAIDMDPSLKQFRSTKGFPLGGG